MKNIIFNLYYKIGNLFKDIFIIKLLLLLFTQLFILSCGDITTNPDDDITPQPSNFLEQVANMLLIDETGYYNPNYSDGGRMYSPHTGITQVFMKEISATKAVYNLRHREFYYGHEIRSGVLYATDEAITNIENINWVGAKKVGELTLDYSDPFLNHVADKKIELCRKYFDPTGRKYIGIGQSTESAFVFVQAISATEAIYENKIVGDSTFIGLSTIDLDLYETEETKTLKDIKWSPARKVGVLE